MTMAVTKSAGDIMPGLGRGSDYVTSEEALRILGVKPQTLYSYVSRGLIRRLSEPAAHRSYYHRRDIARLKARSLARSGHGPAAASAMHWGEPVLATAITEITPQGPRYRGRLALDLAKERRSFESVAQYLWTGALGPQETRWRGAAPAGVAGAASSASPLCHVLTQSILSLGNAPDGRAADLALATGIIRAMAASFGRLGPARGTVALDEDETIAHGLARALGVPTHRHNLDALDAALVLVADHELTPPTFVARIAASVGSNLPACIVAALQVHFGSVLGLCCDRLEQIVESIRRRSKSLAELNPAVERMRSALGFQHPLYENGDPRGIMLVRLAYEIEARRGVVNETLSALAQVLPNVREQPHLCDALVVLGAAMGLAGEAAGGLLALGRSAGWIAHVIEQRAQGFIIRPRGKFEAAPEGSDTSAAAAP